MNAEEARALWVKALRSGEYKQARGRLRSEDSYCCLGVACDLYSKHALKKDAWRRYSTTIARFVSYTFLGQGGALPLEVIKWLGIRGDYGELKDGTTLMKMNDDPSLEEGFETIADVIEKGELVLEEVESND